MHSACITARYQANVLGILAMEVHLDPCTPSAYPYLFIYYENRTQWYTKKEELKHSKTD